MDANTFASLVLLNKEWRKVSDSPQLYAHHLAQCRPFPSARGDAGHTSLTLDDLPDLKGKFACEVRRNAFEVFLRPRKTLINLISTAASSSTAFPQGEAFRFTFSPNGRMLLGLSSSRIFVIDLTSNPVAVRHELKTVRRPLTATILDDGSLLAVASSRHQINTYKLTDRWIKHTQTLSLDEIPRTLALSPEGNVLAIAYDGSVEVHSLGSNVLPTDRRAVRCFGVDSLSFSPDGSMLLGSSANQQISNLLTITAPFYTEEDDVSPHDLLSRMWTSQILFPDVIPGYSHGTFLPSPHEDNGASVFGYDCRRRVFRVIRMDNVRAEDACFVGPEREGEFWGSPLPYLTPAPDSKGELVAIGFKGCGVWVYGIPSKTQDETRSTSSNRTQRRVPPEPSNVVQGHCLTCMAGVTAARWVGGPNPGEVSHQSQQRLVAVAPGGVNFPNCVKDELPVDGGRILVFDFERSSRDGEAKEVTIEVGETEPKLLVEQSTNIDTEVELEKRRRKQANRISRHHFPPGLPKERAVSATGHDSISPLQNITARLPPGSHSQPSSPTDLGPGDTIDISDSPYNNTLPRSHDTLRRAATAAANRGRYQPRFRHSGAVFSSSSELRQEVLIERDSTNWIPPPPYTPGPNAPTWDRQSRPPLTESSQRQDRSSQIQRAYTSRLESITSSAMQRTRSTVQRMSSFSTLSRRNGRADANPETTRSVSAEQPTSAVRTWMARRPATSYTQDPDTQSGLRNNIVQVQSPSSWEVRPFDGSTITSRSRPSTQISPRPELMRSSSMSTVTHRSPGLSDFSVHQRLEIPFPSVPQIQTSLTQLPPSLIAGFRPVDLSNLPPDLNAPLPPLPTTESPASVTPRRGSIQPRPRPLSTGVFYPKANRNMTSPPALPQIASNTVSPPSSIQPFTNDSPVSPPLVSPNNPVHPATSQSPERRQGLNRMGTIDSVVSNAPTPQRMRSRSQVVGGVGRSKRNGTLGTRRRRASTDPQSVRGRRTDEWRSRIEQWNQQTVIETKKKRESRCVVM